MNHNARILTSPVHVGTFPSGVETTLKLVRASRFAIMVRGFYANCSLGCIDLMSSRL